jgi:hypothetical protein
VEETPAPATAAQKLARRRSVIDIPAQSERALAEQEKEAEKTRAQMKDDLKKITRRVSLVQDDWGELEERAGNYVKADGNRGDHSEVLAEGKERVSHLMEDVYDQGLDNIEALETLNEFFEGQVKGANDMRDEVELLTALQAEQTELDNSMRAICNVEGSANKAQDTLGQLTVSIRQAIQHSSDMAREQGEREAEELRQKAAMYVRQMQDELKGTREKLLSSSKQISSMVKAQGSQTHRIQEMQNLIQENERIRDEMQKELAQTQLREEALQNSMQLLDRDSKQSMVLTKSLEACEESLAVTTKLLESKTEHVVRLQSEAVALTASSKAMAAELGKANGTIEKLGAGKGGGGSDATHSLKAKVEELTSTVGERDATVERMEAEMKEMQSKMAESNEKLRAANKANLESEETVAGYRRALDKKKKEAEGRTGADNESAAAQKKSKQAMADMQAAMEEGREKDREKGAKEAARRQSQVEDMVSEMDLVKINLVDLERLLRTKLEEREVDVSQLPDVSMALPLMEMTEAIQQTAHAVTVEFDKMVAEIKQGEGSVEQLHEAMQNLQYGGAAAEEQSKLVKELEAKLMDSQHTRQSTSAKHDATSASYKSGYAAASDRIVFLERQLSVNAAQLPKAGEEETQRREEQLVDASRQYKEEHQKAHDSLLVAINPDKMDAVDAEAVFDYKFEERMHDTLEQIRTAADTTDNAEAVAQQMRALQAQLEVHTRGAKEMQSKEVRLQKALEEERKRAQKSEDWATELEKVAEAKLRTVCTSTQCILAHSAHASAQCILGSHTYLSTTILQPTSNQPPSKTNLQPT